MDEKFIAGFGEVMLRLCPAGKLRIKIAKKIDKFM